MERNRFYAIYKLNEVSLWRLGGVLNRVSVIRSAGFRYWLTEIQQDYFHKVPFILHGYLQRESHEPYAPPTSVT